MKNSVLISIQPKWCELIANGKKTIEVRKTRPKIETPFKCYIYMTNNKEQVLHLLDNPTSYWETLHFGKGKVIGEFVCEDIIADKTYGHNELFKTSACMSDADISAYCLNKEMYCWHISELAIYDKPKDLREFEIECKGGCDIPYMHYPPCEKCRKNRLTRPPQSWCYVAEVV